MANEKLKLYAAGKGVRSWKLADAMKIKDSSLSRKLRHELNEEETEKAMLLIDEIADRIAGKGK